MKELVKRLLKASAFGRMIYEPVHKLYRLYSVPHRRRMLQKNGPMVLRKISEVFGKYNVPGFVAAGSLLGMIRDGGFMPHDDDIDVGVLPGEWTPVALLRLLVEKEHFKFEFGFQFRGKLVEFKVSYAGVPIDVFCYERCGDDLFCTCFYYFPEIKYPAPNANSAWRIHEYNTISLKEIECLGVKFKIPQYPEKVLERLYGESWRVPNPNWDDSMHPGREVLEGEYGYSVDYPTSLES